MSLCEDADDAQRYLSSTAKASDTSIGSFGEEYDQMDIDNTANVLCNILRTKLFVDLTTDDEHNIT